MKGFAEFNILYCPEKLLCQSFKSIQNIFSFDERHFAVDLCELRLPVSPQVFIPETFDYLEIPVEILLPSEAALSVCGDCGRA